MAGPTPTPSTASDGNLKGKLYTFCSKELALTANKRADMFLRNKISSINNERQHCMRAYNLNRLKLTKDLLAIEKSSAQCRKDNFNPANYPGLWEDEGFRGTIEKDGPSGIRLPAIPNLLYGEEPSVFLTHREATLFSEASLSVSEPGDPILEELRRIKDEACARRPRRFVKKQIAVNRFVNDFEWLDNRQTKWFMEKTIKVFHEKLMSGVELEMKLKKEKDLRFNFNKKPSKFMIG